MGELTAGEGPVTMKMRQGWPPGTTWAGYVKEQSGESAHCTLPVQTSVGFSFKQGKQQKEDRKALPDSLDRAGAVAATPSWHVSVGCQR